MSSSCLYQREWTTLVSNIMSGLQRVTAKSEVLWLVTSTEWIALVAKWTILAANASALTTPADNVNSDNQCEWSILAT